MKLTHLEYDQDGLVHCIRTFDAPFIPAQPVSSGKKGIFLAGHDQMHAKTISQNLIAEGGEIMLYLALYDKEGTIHQILTAVSENHAASLRAGEHYGLGLKKIKLSYEDAERIAFHPSLWRVDESDPAAPIIVEK